MKGTSKEVVVFINGSIFDGEENDLLVLIHSEGERFKVLDRLAHHLARTVAINDSLKVGNHAAQDYLVASNHWFTSVLDAFTYKGEMRS